MNDTSHGLHCKCECHSPPTDFFYVDLVPFKDKMKRYKVLDIGTGKSELQVQVELLEDLEATVVQIDDISNSDSGS